MQVLWIRQAIHIPAGDCILGRGAPHHRCKSRIAAANFQRFAGARWRSVATMTFDEDARYRVVLYRAKGCYFAHVPQLPGCVTRGESEVAAVENARQAIRSYLWIMQVLAADRATVELEIKP
jgi:predicted RNase H-like HicB family nuclease